MNRLSESDPLTLADFDPLAFIAHDWQRQPRLFRQVIPDFCCPVDGNDLAGLACEEDIDSRLVIQQGAHWQLESGPFDEARFASLPEQNWTLLVQGVDQWIDEVAELTALFRFLPRWRLQDIMISYAAPGGNVGPHFDQYDVFLLQGQGQRRWKLGQQCAPDAPLQTDQSLRLLQHFDTVEEFILHPGDMLYVPPGRAHWGIADSADCITLSVGFRAPSQGELLQDLGAYLQSRNEDNHRRYRDRFLAPVTDAARISDDALAAARDLIVSALDDDALLADWFGALMTQPQRAVDASWEADLQETDHHLTEQPLTEPQLANALHQGQVRLSLTARLAYRNTSLFADGQLHQVPIGLSGNIATFCQLEPGAVIPTNMLPMSLLYPLYCRGTLAVDTE